MKKKIIVSFLVFVSFSSDVFANNIVNGWINESNYTYYYKNGIIQKGITEIEGTKYFLGENTGRLIKGWVNADDGYTYYMDNNGIVQTGITEIEGIKYFLGENTGRLIKGWVHADDGYTYYMDNNGIVQKGITEIEGIKYFLGENTGRLIKGWVHADDGYVYYTDSQGVLQTGTIVLDGMQYTFQPTGRLVTGWQIINGKTYYYRNDGSYCTGLVKIAGIKYLFNSSGILLRSHVKEIIDVSYYQNDINWTTVANTNIDGAIIRLGYGTSYVTDKCVEDIKFSRNYYETTRTNLLRGIYFYSYAINAVSAQIEADYVISRLKYYNINKNIPIYYDLESNQWTANLTSNDYDIIIKTFISKLNDAGYVVYTYTYKSLAESKFSNYARSTLKWIAQYYKDCTYDGDYFGWQYTSSGTLSGISTNVDMSYFW